MRGQQFHITNAAAAGRRSGVSSSPPSPYLQPISSYEIGVTDPYQTVSLQQQAAYFAPSAPQVNPLMYSYPPVSAGHQQQLPQLHLHSPPIHVFEHTTTFEEYPIGLPDSLTKDIEVFVGGLSFFCRAEHLYQHFQQYHCVIKAKIPMEQKKSDKKGPPMYGFVTFASKIEAENAVKHLNGTLFMGRNMKVEPCDRQRQSTLDMYCDPSMYIRLISLPIPDLALDPSAPSVHPPFESRLRKFFSRFGIVDDVQLNMCTKEHNKYFSYGFVKFDDWATVEDLVAKGEVHYEEYTITCDFNSKIKKELEQRKGRVVRNIHMERVSSSYPPPVHVPHQQSLHHPAPAIHYHYKESRPCVSSNIHVQLQMEAHQKQVEDFQAEEQRKLALARLQHAPAVVELLELKQRSLQALAHNDMNQYQQDLVARQTYAQNLHLPVPPNLCLPGYAPRDHATEEEYKRSQSLSSHSLPSTPSSSSSSMIVLPPPGQPLTTRATPTTHSSSYPVIDPFLCLDDNGAHLKDDSK